MTIASRFLTEQDSISGSRFLVEQLQEGKLAEECLIELIELRRKVLSSLPDLDIWTELRDVEVINGTPLWQCKPRGWVSSKLRQKGLFFGRGIRGDGKTDTIVWCGLLRSQMSVDWSIVHPSTWVKCELSPRPDANGFRRPTNYDSSPFQLTMEEVTVEAVIDFHCGDPDWVLKSEIKDAVAEAQQRHQNMADQVGQLIRLFEDEEKLLVLMNQK